MKKALKIFVLIIVLFTTLGYLGNNLGILEFSDLFPISEEEMKRYSDYYYDQLNNDEKQIYIKLDKAILKNEENISLGKQDGQKVSKLVEKVVLAYVADNPECFYLSNEYAVIIRDVYIAQFATLKIEYIEGIDIEKAKEEMDKTIDKIIQEVITENMTDFEKELALHDKLVEMIDYYDYENIEDIPQIKHSAYGALVQCEAVCDGYAKAFKILLDEVGIKSIIIRGETNNVAHAWNLVNIADEYYHVDVTSDSFINNNKKHTIHIYFNVTDKQISKTHKIASDFKWPQCSAEEYEYYEASGMTLEYEDSVYNKMDKIMKKSKSSNILEFKMDPKYNKQIVLDALYEMNFNNWKTKKLTSIKYSKIDDVYIFIK